MPTVKMSASWENVKRAENLSQMMQKHRNRESGKNAMLQNQGTQEFPSLELPSIAGSYQGSPMGRLWGYSWAQLER